MPALVEIRNLNVRFGTYRGQVHAVNGVDLDIRPGEILGLVGESGSGKSVTSLAIMRLVRPPGRIESGSILFQGADLLKNSEEQMRRLRGTAISMIFQNPRASLNPLFTIGGQMDLIFRVHGMRGGRVIRNAAEEILRKVGIADPDRVLRAYPHQLSGGMCQRVMIAMALSSRPRLLIADEPTTGLDVTLQVQILRLIRNLVSELGSACLLITHDLGVVAEYTDRVAVLYAGQVMEVGETGALFERPHHPYTRGLIASTLRVDEDKPLHVIPGVVPNLLHPVQGCPFRDRCYKAEAICAEQDPPLAEVSPGRPARCHFPER